MSFSYNYGSFYLLPCIKSDFSLLIYYLFSGRSNGDSVTQPEGLVTVTEGSPVLLNCTYQTTYSISYICWYVQYLNKAPQLLLRSATDNKKTEHQGFHATLHKSNSSFHLQKSSVQLSDSALYYCALSDTVRETAGEAAHKPRGQEGWGEWPCEGELCAFSKWSLLSLLKYSNKFQIKVLENLEFVVLLTG